MARTQFFYDVNKRMGRFIMNGFLEKNSDEKSKENQEDLADYIIAKIEAKKKDVQILKVH